MSDRRDVARPIIADVITRVGRDDQKALRAALRDAYPWGERAHWPYKVWCDEVQRQLSGRRYGEAKPERDDVTGDLFGGA